MHSIEVVEADLNRPDHQNAVVELINAYAADPMGNGKPLSHDVRQDLIRGLRQHPTTIIFLADEEDQAIGVAVCFLGFSTFAARPLINIHDLAVLPSHRGKGIGRRLLEEVERRARALGCCKITLEVREDNHRARRIYETVGFEPTALQQEATGAYLFLSKRL
jgi:ribosomal protein S18 acetylase RimI-like enzyme